jgi:hypothetical protein
MQADPVYVCLHLPNGKRIAFPVNVDDYTGLQPTGVYDAILPSGVNSSIAIQFQNATTYSGYLYNDGTQQVSDVYSFVIQIDKGTVISIGSDNANTCSSGCTNGTCRNVSGDSNCFHPVNTTVTTGNDK